MPPSFTITQLRCEYLTDPQGIDELKPRLSWQIESPRRGAQQVGYRIFVASDVENLAEGEADYWDSGYVETERTTHIEYAGAPLTSRAVCHWCVEVLEKAGDSAVSEPAYWTMGLLRARDWSAQWIAADPEIVARDPEAIAPTLTEPGTPAYFEREFNVRSEVRRATVYASARGIIELVANGERVSEDRFAPEWTDYRRRIHYRTYDVTALIREGHNVFNVLLGDGWWSGFLGWQETRGKYGSLENSFMLQLEIDLASGETMTVGTDEHWECATGPLLSSDFLMGEIYDARRAARDWMPVLLVAAPPVALVPQAAEAVRVTEEIPPVSVTEASSGALIYDFGQNITGWVSLRVRALSGTRIQLRHAEWLNDDGTLHTNNLRRAIATDVYICRGDGEETWEPLFTFHGFQFVELTGLPPGLLPNSLTACVVHSAAPGAGFFSCSNPDVNRLWLNTLWSQRGCFLSVPMDSPQRDDRLAWTGPAQIFLRTATYNMDVAAFLTKWMTDISDAQTPDGIFPDTAPRVLEDSHYSGLDKLAGSPGWGDAGIAVPWTLWRVYGDERVVSKHWAAMTAWLDGIDAANPNGLRLNQLGNNYGDWLSLPNDDSFRENSPLKALLATAFWADSAGKMARMADALGWDEDALRFTSMFETVRDAFRAAYLLADGRLGVDRECAYVVALAFDLFPVDSRARAAERLVEHIGQAEGHFTSGIFGRALLNPTLTLHGHAEVAYRLLLQDTFPSWLGAVKQGATTIWERCNGWTQEDGFFNSHLNSFNYASLGSIGEWLFRHVAGIELDAGRPGFQHFVLRPFIADGLTHAQATYRGIHGEIGSHWTRDGEELTWEIVIPANTSARVFIPCGPIAAVTESGVMLARSEGLRIIGREKHAVVCVAGAGSYRFESTLAAKSSPRAQPAVTPTTPSAQPATQSTEAS